MTSPEAAAVVRGCCHLCYALDIGFSVDLKRCAGLIQEADEGGVGQHHARAPSYGFWAPAILPCLLRGIVRRTYWVNSLDHNKLLPLPNVDGTVQ